MKKSRKKTIIKCLECDKIINGGSHMSRHVQKEHNYSSYAEYKIKHNLIKTQKILEDEGAISCEMCGIFSHDLTSHILHTHKIDPSSYKEKYGALKSQKYLINQSFLISGEKNPGYKHNGRLSPVSNNFIYSNLIDKEEVIKKISNSNKNNGNNNTTLIYWLNKGLTEHEAKLELSKRQTTFSLNSCIKKYGREQGIEKWVKRQEKWQESCKKNKMNGFSKISQEMFWKLYSYIEFDKDFIFFAELGPDKNIDSSGINNEYRLKLPERILLPDFINTKTKKIIEFDGTYWHSEKIIKNTNKLRDHQRDELLILNGFDVLHIKEEYYKNNKDKAIKDCLEFLNG